MNARPERWIEDAARISLPKQAPQRELPTLALNEWLGRDLPAPDLIMGKWLSTTSRVLLVAATGLGKTMFCLALGAHISDGLDFMHWKANRRARVLYIDGEMSARLLKMRLANTVERLDTTPDTFFALSHEDIPNFAPLNTAKGQAQIEAVIERIGGVDLIIFDNIMSLLDGDMKDATPWQQVMPWVKKLTARSIGQLWIHHTGHDETKSYGDKSREWQLDTVIQLERAERLDTDVAFNRTFKKARERTPDNRADFQNLSVALVNGRWEHNGAARGGKRLPPLARKFLSALDNALASDDATQFMTWKAVPTEAWQAEETGRWRVAPLDGGFRQRRCD
jgi:RecA-family ATPase